MRVEGYWLECLDGVIRPVVKGFVQLPDGDWCEVVFLLDAGADRTVIASDYLPMLAQLLLPEEQSPQLGGVGGQAATLAVQTRLAFERQDGIKVPINGPYNIFTDQASTDMSILGRDVTNNFDVIYSYPKQEVLLLYHPHGYVVQPPF